MQTHVLKFKGKDLCDAVYDGRKTHEIRLNDRNYQEGDLIVPVPLADDGTPMIHPIKDKLYEIGFVSDNWPKALKDGYCVFSIHEVKGGI